jgi:hypothetical protein
MTWDIISNRFDVLLSSYEGGIVLDEYEKSTFFNKAHRDLVREYYLGMTPTGTAFESSEEVRAYLSKYIKKIDIEGIKEAESTQKLESDVWYIIREYISYQGRQYPVVPVLYDEYSKVHNNPFRNKESKRRALRIIDASTAGNITLEWWGSTTDETATYTYYYISEPVYTGIEIVDTIVSSIEDIDIHTSFLEIVLQRAIDLVKLSRSYTQKNNV